MRQLVFARKEWGSRIQTIPEAVRDPGPESVVVIHHSGDDHIKPGDSIAHEMKVVRQHEAFHIDIRKWLAIGYNWLVSPNGHIYEGRGWEFKGSHAGQINGDSIGICILMDGTKSAPTPAAMEAVRSLIAQGVELGEIKPDYTLSGHRDHRQTTCPGDKVYAVLAQLHD